MSSRSLASILVLTLAAFSLAFAACSSGGDDDDGNGTDTAATSPAADGGDEADEEDQDDGEGKDAGGNGGGGGGTATLTVGDEVYEFDGVLCAFSLEESQSEDFPFNLSAFGESATGARTQLTADIYDPSGKGRYEGDGVSYNVELDDIDDFENPSVAWSTSSVDSFVVDGNNVDVSGAFDNGLTDLEFESIPGTLEAVCF